MVLQFFLLFLIYVIWLFCRCCLEMLVCGLVSWLFFRVLLQCSCLMCFRMQLFIILFRKLFRQQKLILCRQGMMYFRVIFFRFSFMMCFKGILFVELSVLDFQCVFIVVVIDVCVVEVWGVWFGFSYLWWLWFLSYCSDRERGKLFVIWGRRDFVWGLVGVVWGFMIWCWIGLVRSWRVFFGDVELLLVWWWFGLGEVEVQFWSWLILCVIGFVQVLFWDCFWVSFFFGLLVLQGFVF